MANYWIKFDGFESGIAESGNSAALGHVLDSDGNIYTYGALIRTYYKPILRKYSKDGFLLWEKEIFNSSYSSVHMYVAGICIDSSDNIYVACGIGATTKISCVIKLNTSGNILMQRILSTGQTFLASDIALDVSNNIIVCGVNTFELGDVEIIKLDSTGAPLWTKRIAHGIGNGRADASTRVLTDSLGNIYVNGNFWDGSYDRAFLYKISSDGSSIVWSKYRNIVESYSTRSLFIDSSDNIYTSVYSTNMGGGGELHKFDSSGSAIYNRKLISDAAIFYINGMSIDSVGNIYVAGQTNSKATLIKLDSTVTSVDWARILAKYISTTSYTSMFNSCSIDTTNTLTLSGSFYNENNNQKPFVTRLPNNGSGMNNYGELTYASTTFTITSANQWYVTGPSIITDTVTSIPSSFIMIDRNNTTLINWSPA